jgi:hypothetical protein
MNREKQELLSELASVGVISQEMAQLVRYEYLFKQLLCNFPRDGTIS